MDLQNICKQFQLNLCWQKKVTKNECREVEVPVCTKEPSTVPKQVCKDVPREVRTPCPASHSNYVLWRNSHLKCFARFVLRRCCPRALQWRSKSVKTFAKTFARISTGARSAPKSSSMGSFVLDCEAQQIHEFRTETQQNIQSVYSLMCQTLYWNKHLPVQLLHKPTDYGVITFWVI